MPTSGLFTDSLGEIKWRTDSKTEKLYQKNHQRLHLSKYYGMWETLFSAREQAQSKSTQPNFMQSNQFFTDRLFNVNIW